jgi:hypothetical protein
MRNMTGRYVQDPVALFDNWYRGFAECARIIDEATRPNRTLPWQLSYLMTIEGERMRLHRK